MTNGFLLWVGGLMVGVAIGWALGLNVGIRIAKRRYERGTK